MLNKALMWTPLLEGLEAADAFQDNRGGEDGQGHKDADAGFKGVFHRLNSLSLF